MDTLYAFQTLTPAHIKGIARLAEQVFSVSRSEEYWTWKLLACPLGPVCSVVIVHQDEVVGLLGAMPSRFVVDGLEVTGVGEVDFAIAEKHRRLDLYLNLVRFYLQRLEQCNCRFTYGFQNANAAQINETFGAKTTVGTLPQYVKILKSGFLLEKMTGRPSFSAVAAAAIDLVLRVLNNRPFRLPAGTRLALVDTFDERFDRLWELCRNDYAIMKIRDAQYLNWRYRDAVHLRTEKACIETVDTGALLGFIVFCERQDSASRRGRILECIVPSCNDQRLHAVLLTHAITTMMKNDVDLVDCWASNRMALVRALKQLGFYCNHKQKSPYSFSVATLCENGLPRAFLASWDSWFLSLGDADID